MATTLVTGHDVGTVPTTDERAVGPTAGIRFTVYPPRGGRGPWAYLELYGEASVTPASLSALAAELHLWAAELRTLREGATPSIAGGASRERSGATA